jgi:hypothetical protein
MNILCNLPTNGIIGVIQMYKKVMHRHITFSATLNYLIHTDYLSNNLDYHNIRVSALHLLTKKQQNREVSINNFQITRLP